MADERQRHTHSLADLVPEKPASKPTQSMGLWIDNLLGDKKARERAAQLRQERLRRWSQIEYRVGASE